MLCKTCNQERDESEFESAGTIKGKRYLRKKCRYCINISTNERYKKNRIFLDDYKKDRCCVICGFSDYRALIFHHIDKDNKEVEVSNLIRVSIKKILEEIAKCVLICANCHSVFHYNERNGISNEHAEMMMRYSISIMSVAKDCRIPQELFLPSITVTQQNSRVPY